MPEPTIWENMSGYMGKNPRLTGALGGAAVGGLAGAMMDNENRLRGGLLGASAGGVIGYGAGTIHDLSNKNTALTDTNKGLTGQVDNLSTTAARLKKKLNLAQTSNTQNIKTIDTLSLQNKNISQESNRLQAELDKKQQRDKSYQVIKGKLSLTSQENNRLQKQLKVRPTKEDIVKLRQSLSKTKTNLAEQYARYSRLASTANRQYIDLYKRKQVTIDALNKKLKQVGGKH